MKFIKTLAIFSAAAAAVLTANAQVDVVITGSTAYRSSVHNAITSSTGTGGLGFTQVAYTGSSASGANAALYTGTYNGTSYRIKTSWSGSAAGIQTVAATSPTFTVGTLANTANGSGQADPRASANGGTPQNPLRPDIAMADNTQSSTLFNGSYNGVTYTTLNQASANGTQQTVGIVPFVFVASKSANTVFGFVDSDATSSGRGYLNVTAQAAQAVYTTLGFNSLELFTANSSDSSTQVFAFGRDPDSGTRIVTLAETGIGANTGLQQVKPSSSNGTFTSLALYAATTINGVPVPAGNSGESSGGAVATILGNSGPSQSVADAFTGLTSTSGGFGIAYLSSGDAATAVSNGAIKCTYNGVPYTVANVQNGRYTLWGNEQLYYRSDIGTTKQALADKIATAIYKSTATILPSTMAVSRASDGGNVLPTFQ